LVGFFPLLWLFRLSPHAISGIFPLIVAVPPLHTPLVGFFPLLWLFGLLCLFFYSCLLPRAESKAFLPLICPFRLTRAKSKAFLPFIRPFRLTRAKSKAFLPFIRPFRLTRAESEALLPLIRSFRLTRAESEALLPLSYPHNKKQVPPNRVNLLFDSAARRGYFQLFRLFTASAGILPYSPAL
ncbi:hypothetical protein M2105_005048, partial [Paenibacillus sp. PastF-1]|nr:hypothetical protein [Paenibacillus sp. PastF-1]MDH6482441.1 hypothetical protein [Paenibacillus sp. PastH-2]